MVLCISHVAALSHSQRCKETDFSATSPGPFIFLCEKIIPNPVGTKGHLAMILTYIFLPDNVELLFIYLLAVCMPEQMSVLPLSSF